MKFSLLALSAAVGTAPLLPAVEAPPAAQPWTLPADSPLSRPPATASRASGFFVAPNLGTLGMGLEGGYALSPSFKLRVRSNWIGCDFKKKRHGVAYTVKAENMNGGLMLDYHPEAGVFRLTAGLLLSNLDARADGSTNGQSFVLGGNPYVAQGNVCLRGKYAWNRVQPYLGMGWSTESTADGSWYVTADIGVALIGNGRLTTSSTGEITDGHGHTIDHDQIQESIREEVHDVLKVCDHLHVYPVLQIGVGYRF